MAPPSALIRTLPRDVGGASSAVRSECSNTDVEQRGVVTIERWDRRDTREGRARLAELVAELLRKSGNDVSATRLIVEGVMREPLETEFRKLAALVGRDPDHEVERVHAVVDGDFVMVSTLIDDERYEEASQQLDVIAARVGEEDLEVVRLRTTLHFLATS